MKHVLSTQELKVFWDKFTLSYLKTGNSLHSLFYTMCDLTITEENKLNTENILEMACGSGKGLIHLAKLFQDKKVNIHGTDISTNMLDIACNNLMRLSKKNEINFVYKEHKNIVNDSLPSISISQCDNEDMNVFPDKYFDVILSNNSLHLVADPNKMLKEANRLLKDNGTACFTIWGRPENSFAFTLTPNTLKKLNIPTPNLRSNFHISKESILTDLLKANGFHKFNICHIFIPFPINEPNDFYHNLEAPIYKEILNKMNDDEKLILFKEIDQEIKNKLERNELIGAEFNLIKCSKL